MNDNFSDLDSGNLDEEINNLLNKLKSSDSYNSVALSNKVLELLKQKKESKNKALENFENNQIKILTKTVKEVMAESVQELKNILENFENNQIKILTKTVKEVMAESVQELKNMINTNFPHDIRASHITGSHLTLNPDELAFTLDHTDLNIDDFDESISKNQEGSKDE